MGIPTPDEARERIPLRSAFIARPILPVILALWITGACILSGCRCHSDSRTDGDGGMSLEPARLRTADPVIDLQAAVRAGELRFIGTITLGHDLPGLEFRPDLVPRHGVRGYVALGDTAESSLADAVYEYAEIYNLLLGRHLDRQEKPAAANARTQPKSRLAEADPVADLRAAMDGQDFRFLTLQRYGEYIPGAQNRPRLTARHGVRYLEIDDEAWKLHKDRATEYLHVYNLLLVRHFRRAGEVTGPEWPATTLLIQGTTW